MFILLLDINDPKLIKTTKYSPHHFLNYCHKGIVSLGGGVLLLGVFL